MATFTFTCPHCQQKFEADEEWIGMQAECPACKQNITIAKETEQPKVVLKPVSADKKSANNPSDKGVLKSKVVIRCPKTEENEKLIIQTLSDELEGHFQSDIEQNGNEFKTRFLNVLTCKTVRINVIPRSDDSYELVSEFSSKVSKAFFFFFGIGALLIFWGLFASIMSFIVNQCCDTYFVFQYLSQPDFMNKYSNLANGTGQKELSEKDFLNFDIVLPALDVQKSIGNILHKTNNYIEKQCKIFIKLCQQQKAMQQLLLTGIIRV